MPDFIDFPVDGVITQRFGGRHGGVDVAGPDGSPVYAPDGGYLRLWPQGTQGDGSFGNAADISTPDGWTVKYAHMREFASGLAEGPIQAGTRLGLQGWTGFVQPAGPGGSHVHWGMCRDPRFPRFTGASASNFGDPLNYMISEAERMALFQRLERIEQMLGGYSGESRIQQWVSNGNLPLLDCLGNQPGQLAAMVMEWPGIREQTYGTNNLLLQWRGSLAASGIMVP